MSTKTASNEKIYQDYRTALRGIKKAEKGTGRAAARKQTALKQVADRHSVRIGEVKQLVRDFDQLNNLTHEHPAQYKKELIFEEACAQATIKHADDIANQFCPQCKNAEAHQDKNGNLVMPGDKGNEVRVRVNPFEAELYGDLTPMIACYVCYLEISHDV